MAFLSYPDFPAFATSCKRSPAAPKSSSFTLACPTRRPLSTPTSDLPRQTSSGDENAHGLKDKMFLLRYKRSLKVNGNGDQDRGRGSSRHQSLGVSYDVLESAKQVRKRLRFLFLKLHLFSQVLLARAKASEEEASSAARNSALESRLAAVEEAILQLIQANKK